MEQIIENFRIAFYLRLAYDVSLGKCGIKQENVRNYPEPADVESKDIYYKPNIDLLSAPSVYGFVTRHVTIYLKMDI